MADSTVTIVGNTTRDFELRYTANATPVGTAGVAVNRRWQSDGEWKEETSFFNVVCFGQMAENCAASLTKGSRIIVSGRLQQRSWENDDGDKRSVVEIVADDIGASTRWAEVSIVRNERQKQSSDGGQKQADPESRYVDEEPF